MMDHSLSFFDLMTTVQRRSTKKPAFASFLVQLGF